MPACQQPAGPQPAGLQPAAPQVAAVAATRRPGPESPGPQGYIHVLKQPHTPPTAPATPEGQQRKGSETSIIHAK